MYRDLRRLLASLDYRFVHATREAPEGFGAFAPGSGARTPLEIVGHLCNLLTFIRLQFAGPESEAVSEHSFEAECRRFRASLRTLDRHLAEGRPFTPDRDGLDYQGLLQGPVSDALTHVGQLALLRRLAGSPVEGVRYWRVAMPLPAGAESE